MASTEFKTPARAYRGEVASRIVIGGVFVALAGLATLGVDHLGRLVIQPEWRTGLMVLAGAVLILLGQIFFQQYFEIQRAKARMLDILQAEDDRTAMLIGALERAQSEPKFQIRKPVRRRAKPAQSKSASG